MKNIFIIFFSGLVMYLFYEGKIIEMNFNQLSSEELLNKSIAYHDPNNSWNNFNGIYFSQILFQKT